MQAEGRGSEWMQQRGDRREWWPLALDLLVVRGQQEQSPSIYKKVPKFNKHTHAETFSDDIWLEAAVRELRIKK